MQADTTDSVSGSVAKSLVRDLAKASIADKITVFGFIGTLITICYSAITFLPNLEQRVDSLEAEVKNVERVRIEAEYLTNAIKKSQTIDSEVQSMRNENSELKGKVTVLEQLVLKNK